jgi:HEAT repeat protein
MERVELLIEQLRDNDRRLRIFAATELAMIGEPAIGALSAMLGDANVSVRKRAVLALGEIGGSLAIKPLSWALADGDPYVRKAAVIALGKIDDARIVEPLARMLTDGDSLIREAAIAALLKISDPRAVAPLSQLLADNNPLIRVTAFKSLMTIGVDDIVGWLVRALLDPAGDEGPNAGAVGNERAYGYLMSLLSGDDPETRIMAAKTLGKVAAMPATDALWRARITDTLSRALADRNEDVRIAIVGILGGIGGERVLHPLLVALKARDSTVRAAAAVVLGELKDPIALPKLLARLNPITGERVKEVHNRIAEAVDSIQRAMADMQADS